MNKKVLWFSEKTEHQKLARAINGVEFFSLPKSPLKKVWKIISSIKIFKKDYEKIHLILPSNIQTSFIAPILKILKGVTFDIWVDRIDKKSTILSVFDKGLLFFARKIFIPSKPMKHSLSGFLKKSVVIPHWINDKKSLKKTDQTRPYKIFSIEKKKFRLGFDERFVKVNNMFEADAIFFSYPSKYFQFQFDKEIFNAISTGKPVFIEYSGNKTVNKLFSDVKSVIHIHKQMSLNDIELEIIHAKEMKIPKKYSFSYNLAKTKKALKEFL